MKLFRRMMTLSTFGAGFLLGSRSGREAWDKAQAKFNELTGKAQEQLENNPQVKEKVEQAKEQVNQVKETVAPSKGTKDSKDSKDSTTTGKTADLREGQLTEI